MLFGDVGELEHCKYYLTDSLKQIKPAKDIEYYCGRVFAAVALKAVTRGTTAWHTRREERGEILCAS